MMSEAIQVLQYTARWIYKTTHSYVELHHLHTRTQIRLLKIFSSILTGDPIHVQKQLLAILTIVIKC